MKSDCFTKISTIINKPDMYVGSELSEQLNTTGLSGDVGTVEEPMPVLFRPRLKYVEDTQ
jgi:hypothetical protein